MITANLAVLQVLLPLIAAPICSLINIKHISWLFAAIITFLSLACAIQVFIQVDTSGVIFYHMGGWVAPFGIQYRIDNLGAIFLVLISTIASFTIVYAKNSVEKEIAEDKYSLFYSIYLFCLAGSLGVVATNDIFNIYVFLEISLLATYALIAMGQDRRALTASFEYLILGSIGATFILIAIGLIYSLTGSLNISDISQILKTIPSSMSAKMALAFFTIGIILKIAMFPLHLWLVNSYTYAPSFVSSFLAGVATKVGIFVLIRITFSMFGFEFSFKLLPLGYVLIITGALSILVCSVIAIMQDNLKRMLSYSSVAQFGYVLLGIGLLNNQGASAALLQIIFHSITKAAMFMAAGAILYNNKVFRIESLEGVGKKMPFTMAAFVISGLSLIGIPGTVGFIAKWHLIEAAIVSGMWPVFIIILVSSLLTLVYIWKVVEIAFFGYMDANNEVTEAPFLMVLPICLLSLSLIIFGIWPVYITESINKIVSVLFAVT